MFQEKIGGNKSQLHKNELGEYKMSEQEETEWQARSKQLDLSKLKDVEESQITKEQRLRDASKQKPVQPTLSRTAAQIYEQQIDQGKQAILEHAQKVTRKEISQVFNTAKTGEEEEEVDYKDVKLKSWKKDQEAAAGGPGLVPTESESREKQVSTHVSKQVQKGREGDTEITRHITETETEEKEHGEKTVERVVTDGKPKFKKAPLFTKKIQPCRAFEKEAARFDVEFDGVRKFPYFTNCQFVVNA